MSLLLNTKVMINYPISQIGREISYLAIQLLLEFIQVKQRLQKPVDCIKAIYSWNNSKLIWDFIFFV